MNLRWRVLGLLMIASWFVGTAPLRAVEGGVPFGNASLKQACTEAAGAQKKVLVAFWGEWSEDSRKLQRTFAEQGALKAFVDAQTVAVQFEVTRVPELSRRFHVFALPTVILLNADGTEIDRWVGDVSAGRLASELPAALKGRTTLLRVRDNPPKSVEDRFKNARRLIQEGSVEAALAELLWIYDEGIGVKFAVKELSVSEVIRHIGALRGAGSLADEALAERRAQAVEAIVKQPGRTTAVLQLLMIDLARGNAAASVELWQKLPVGAGRDTLAAAVVPILVQERRFDEAVKVFSLTETVALLRKPTAAVRLAKREVIRTFIPARLGAKQAEAAYATFFFAAFAATGQMNEAKEVGAFVMEKGGAKTGSVVLRAAATRVLGARADAFVESLGLPLTAVETAMAAGPNRDNWPDKFWENEAPSSSVQRPAADEAEASIGAAGVDEIVRMEAFVVGGKPRGMLPLSAGWQFNRITGKITMIPVIGRPGAAYAAYHGRLDPERNGLRPGERVLAVAGDATGTMKNSRLLELYRDGDVGDEVKIVVQGTGADAAVFREVVLKRIAVAKPGVAPK